MLHSFVAGLPAAGPCSRPAVLYNSELPQSQYFLYTKQIVYTIAQSTCELRVQLGSDMLSSKVETVVARKNSILHQEWGIHTAERRNSVVCPGGS